MKREIFSDLKIHPVYLGKVTSRRQSIAVWIGFHETQSLNLILKVSDPLSRYIKFMSFLSTAGHLTQNGLTQHDVKLGCKLANRRTHRREIHDQRTANLCGSRFQHKVHRIPRVTFDVALSSEFSVAF